MNPSPPDLAADAPWKQRYRRPKMYELRIARGRRDVATVLSDASGVPQSYAVDLRTGETEQLTGAPAGTIFATPTPDGRHCLALDDLEGNELGHWTRIPITGGDAHDLTPDMAPYSSWLAEASPDGSLVVLAISDDDGTSLWRCRPGRDAEPPGRLQTSPGLALSLTFMADGDAIVCQTSGPTRSNAYALVAIDVETGEEVASLWDGEPTSMGWCVASPLAGDRRVATTSNVSGRDRPLLWDIRTGERTDIDLAAPGDVGVLDWSDDGRTLLLFVADRAQESLWLFDIASGSADRVPTDAGSFDGAGFGPEGVVALAEHALEPASIVALGSDRARTIVGDHEAPPGYPWRSVSFPSSDGTSIQAWLLQPEGAGPFPTILHVHGGPEAVTTERYSPELASWVDHGYAVASLNYRGSVTFGREYQQAIWLDFGHWEIEDLAATAEWLVAEGVATPGGIVLTGASYGGYLTLLGLGRLPALWAGGIAYVAVADFVGLYEESAATLRAYVEQVFGGPPDANPELYRRASPITYVADVAAPVLVFQGSNDTRCPPGQFIAYEQAARAAGRSIEVEWFEAGHIGPDIEHQIADQERALAFAAKLFVGTAM